MKTCSCCKQSHPKTNFYKTSVGTLFAYCMPCHRQKTKERYARIRPADRPVRILLDYTKPRACPMCKQVKAPEQYYNCLDRKSSYCKTCHSERSRRLYREKVLGKQVSA